MGKPLPAITAPLEMDEPLPSRWRGVKRALIGVGVGLLLLVGLRVWWGWEASRQLEAEIALYRSRGEPVWPEDFREPAVADSENAAVALWEAAKGIRQTEEYRKLHGPEGPPSSPWSAEAMGWAGATLRANREILEQVRAARALVKVSWREVRERPDVRSDVGGGVAVVLRLGVLLHDAVRWAHQQGDHAGAAEYLRDMLFVARAVGQAPDLGSCLAALSLEGRAAMEALQRAWEMSAEARANRLRDVQPVERDRLLRLIDELDAGTLNQQRLVRGLQAERAAALEVLRRLAGERLGADRDGALAPVTATWPERLRISVFWPQYELAVARGVRALTLGSKAATAENWPAAFIQAGPAGAGGRRDTGLALVWWQRSEAATLEEVYAGSPRMSLRTHFTTATLRRAAALSLAIQLYQADHDGRAPARLTELVPAYLRELPTDPLHPADGAIGYGIVAACPFIYSVGEDGRDDLAAKTWAPAAGEEPSWRAPDLVFFLPQRTDPASRPDTATRLGD